MANLTQRRVVSLENVQCVEASEGYSYSDWEYLLLMPNHPAHRLVVSGSFNVNPGSTSTKITTTGPTTFRFYFNDAPSGTRSRHHKTRTMVCRRPGLFYVEHGEQPARSCEKS